MWFLSIRELPRSLASGSLTATAMNAHYSRTPMPLNCFGLRKISTGLNMPLMPIWKRLMCGMNSIKQDKSFKISSNYFCRGWEKPVLICEGTIIPVQTIWNSLASLPTVSLNLRATCVKSVAKLVNRLLFSIFWRKYFLLNWGQIYIVLSLHHILITV